jgi:23S rRNA pseudouridine2605 synthase
MPSPRLVTLARALSKLGIASRSEARALIEAGRIRVGGRPVRDPDRWLDPDRERIELDGRPLVRATPSWFMLHKPVGCVTTRSDERGRVTVRDLLPPGLPFVSPVGRLDMDSSGLLLLTNDTLLAARIAGPDSGCPKVYEVVLDAPLRPADLAAFAAGFELEGARLRPVRVRVDPARPERVRLTLTEGRNRQIRRMCAARGREVLALHRIAIGTLRLGALEAGAVRPLTEAEVRALRVAAGGEPTPRRPRRAG